MSRVPFTSLHRWCRYYVAASALMIWGIGSLQAHPLAPALLQLQQLSETDYRVDWRVSLVAAAPTPLQPVFPDDCVLARELAAEVQAGVRVQHWLLRCAGSMQGRSVSIAGLARSPINVILRVDWQDGRQDLSFVPLPFPHPRSGLKVRFSRRGAV